MILSLRIKESSICLLNRFRCFTSFRQRLSSLLRRCCRISWTTWSRSSCDYQDPIILSRVPILFPPPLCNIGLLTFVVVSTRIPNFGEIFHEIRQPLVICWDSISLMVTAFGCLISAQISPIQKPFAKDINVTLIWSFGQKKLHSKLAYRKFLSKPVVIS